MKSILLIIVTAACIFAQKPDSEGVTFRLPRRDPGEQVAAIYFLEGCPRDADGKLLRPETTDSITASMWTKDGSEYKAEWVKVAP